MHDYFTGPLAELRAAHQDALTRFREECAPEVGPTVTCRGITISTPTRVPVDPAAYWAAAWRNLKSAATKAMANIRKSFTALADAFGSIGKTMREAQNTTQNDYVLTADSNGDTP